MKWKNGYQLKHNDLKIDLFPFDNKHKENNLKGYAKV